MGYLHGGPINLRSVNSMIMSSESNIQSFLFRDIHPALFMGTASDRYKGWLGQIYTPHKYERRIKRRTKKVGGKSFVEETLPVDSVQEYFEHFSVLELDFTFYSTLKDSEGRHTSTYHTLRSYSQYLREGDRIILKVPQIFFARKVWQKEVFAENPYYLDTEAFREQFYEPALELVGPWLCGMLFEQEYHRKEGRPEPAIVAQELDRFFSRIPHDSRYHVELRTEAFLCPELFKVLEHHGIGQVLSHWTWLPSLKRQFSLSKEKFFSASGDLIIRLMTPRGMRYEDAYARAHPFDKLVDGMLHESMLNHTVEISRKALEAGVRPNIIINNRAGGNAPLVAQKIATAFIRSLPSPKP